MWFAPVVAIGICVYLIFYHPFTLWFAFPALVMWLLSPAIVWWLSKPISPDKKKLNENQLLFLRNLARKTWSFFEYFVTEEENWLPPDNFQQHPVSVIAHRTSSPNIGLSLLANLTAFDF
jgi:hypothetical protein